VAQTQFTSELKFHTVILFMPQEYSLIQRLIDEPLEERLAEALVESPYGRSSHLVSFFGSFFLHGYLFADSVHGLSITAKLSILCALEEVLRNINQSSFALSELRVDRLISCGDYGIDIKDVIAVSNGYKIMVAADGGSGNALTGEALDEPLRITVGDLCREAYATLSDWEAIDWTEVCSQDLEIGDGSMTVSPDEGMDGFGIPVFSLISPDGKEIQLEGESISVNMEEGPFSGRGSVLISHKCNGETIEFQAEYDLSECESVCLGYDLGWEVSRTSFGKALDDAIAHGLALLRQEVG
jgi:hypothetical protein